MSRLDAIRKAREWVVTTNNAQEQLTRPISRLEVLEPRYSVEEILGIVNPDIRFPINMLEVLVRMVDDSRMQTFKPLYGKGMITAWAHIHGTFLYSQLTTIHL